MENLNLEKFIFILRCYYKDSDIQKEFKRVSIILTLNSLYFFNVEQPSKQHKNEEINEIFELERNGFEKIDNDDWYISTFEEKSNSITINISKRYEDKIITILFKDVPKKDETNVRDFLNICLLLDGYKINCQRFKLDFSSNLDWLFIIIDSYLLNQIIIIDEKFFYIENQFLSFERFTVKMKFLHPNYCNIFIDVFTGMDFSQKLKFPKLCFLKVIKFVNNNLTDQHFKEYMIKIFDHTPSLTELEISTNEISGQSLKELSEIFKFSLRHLENLNFSNNWIDDFGMEEFFYNAFFYLSKLTFINLSQNFLDNKFLKNFNYCYVKKYRKYERVPKIEIDFSKNRFDLHLLKNKFFEWKSDEDDIEKNERTYSFNNFLNNLAKMQAKYIFKYELVKHFTKADSYFTKMILEKIKTYTISVKTTKLNDNLQERSSSIKTYNDLDILFNELDKYLDYSIIKSNINNSIINLDNSKDSSDSVSFNPSQDIEDFHRIFKIIKEFPMSISYIQLHLYISSLKIKVFQSIKSKNLYELKYLCQICDYFETSNMETIDTELTYLNSRSKIINEALHDILNFEGNLIEKNKNFFSEINNFLDIFIIEANKIKLKNEIVQLAEHIQFIRNNKLRVKFFSNYQDILKEERLMNSNILADEFDVINNKYKDISDYKLFRLPEEIIVKIASLHPNKLDYLILCESKKGDLEQDLASVSKKLKEDESYGLRNIHDRIHFFFSFTNDKTLDPNSKFYLNKGNDLLKISRVLFRYLNNMDYKILFNENQFFEYLSFTRDNIQFDYTVTDKDSILNYEKLRIKMKDSQVVNQAENKGNRLKFTSEIIKISLIHCENRFEKEFNDIAIVMNTKLLRIFVKEFEESNTSNLKFGIKEFFHFFKGVKEKYIKDSKMIESLNEEIILQILNILNEITGESIKIKYIFGFLNVMSFHIYFSDKFFDHFKKWINHQIKNNYYTEYCKDINSNLINYKNKNLLWIPSIIEINARLELKEIEVVISISGIEEKYVVTETTKIGELFNQILNNSTNIQNIVEKKFYWLFLKSSEREDYIPLYYEEYVLEVISLYEEKLTDLKPNIYNIIKFYFRRRIFSSFLLYKDYKFLLEIELQMIYNQVKKKFLNKLFSGIISDSDSILLCTILTEIQARKIKIHTLNFNNLEDIQIFISNNIIKIIPKHKKRIFSLINHQNFLNKFQQFYKNFSISEKNDRQLKEEFLKIIRSYDFFFSSHFHIKSKSNNNFFFIPERFILVVNPNGFLIIDESKLEIVHKLEFHDLIYTFFNSSDPQTLFLSFQNENISNRNEKRFKFFTEEARIISEDILSYCQLCLFVNPSKLVLEKKLEVKKKEKVAVFYNLFDYSFIYQRNLPYMKVVDKYLDPNKYRSWRKRLHLSNKGIDEFRSIESEIESKKIIEKSPTQKSNKLHPIINNNISILKSDKETPRELIDRNENNVALGGKIETIELINSKNNNQKFEPNFSLNNENKELRTENLPKPYNILNSIVNSDFTKDNQNQEKKGNINIEINYENLKNDIKNPNFTVKDNNTKNSIQNIEIEEKINKNLKKIETIENKNLEENSLKLIKKDTVKNQNNEQNNQDKKSKESTNTEKDNYSPILPHNLNELSLKKTFDKNNISINPPEIEKKTMLVPSINLIENNTNNNKFNIKPEETINNNIQVSNNNPISTNNSNKKTIEDDPDIPIKKANFPNFEGLNKKFAGSKLNLNLPKLGASNSNLMLNNSKISSNSNLSINSRPSNLNMSNISPKLNTPNLNSSIFKSNLVNHKLENEAITGNSDIKSNESIMKSDDKIPKILIDKPIQSKFNNNYITNFDKTVENLKDKPNETNFNNAYNTIDNIQKDSIKKEQEKKENFNIEPKRDSIKNDSLDKKKSIDLTRRVSKLLSSLNITENSVGTLNSDRSSIPRNSVISNKKTINPEETKSPLNKFQNAKDKINKAMKLIPDISLFTKKSNPKGIDPTSKMNI